MSISKIEFLRKRWGNLRKVENANLRSLSYIKSARKTFQPQSYPYRDQRASVGASFLVPMLYRGFVPALCFNLRPTPPDLYNQMGGGKHTNGICESNDPNPADADEHKPRWK